MTYKHFILTIVLFFILLSGCAHYETDYPVSGEAAPPIESEMDPEPPIPVGTGGGTVLDESDW